MKPSFEQGYIFKGMQNLKITVIDIYLMLWQTSAKRIENRNQCDIHQFLKELIKEIFLISLLFNNLIQSKLMNPYTMYAFPAHSYDNIRSVTQFPSFTQSIIQTLLAKDIELRSEIAELKESFKNIQNQLQLFRETQSQIAMDSENQNNFDGVPNKKMFTKHLACPHPTCQKKYSTNISLRAHLRRKHPRQTHQ